MFTTWVSLQRLQLPGGIIIHRVCMRGMTKNSTEHLGRTGAYEKRGELFRSLVPQSFDRTQHGGAICRIETEDQSGPCRHGKAHGNPEDRPCCGKEWRTGSYDCSNRHPDANPQNTSCG